MKTLRSLFVLTCACALAASSAFADRPADRKARGRTSPAAACACITGQDGKVCGIDKDCCCTGKKAKGRPEQKKSGKNKSAKTGTGCDSCGA
jgi:hypothetical protein